MGEPPRHECLLTLSNTLQTTLVLEQVFELFAKHVKRLVAFDGLVYRFGDQGIDFKLGHRHRYTCSFRLAVNDEPLGEIKFSRRTPFHAREQETLRTCVCPLIYPVRNALLYRQARRDAFKDPVTGICNRAAMNDVLNREVELATRQRTPLSLIVIDIDHFKRVNDTYGHATGDCLLKSLAEWIKDTVRGSDLLFRFGGEEFVVLLNNTDEQGALQLAERIRQNVETMSGDCREHDIQITISAGVATLRHGEHADQLFTKADEALYLAKTEGRNRVRLRRND